MRFVETPVFTKRVKELSPTKTTELFRSLCCFGRSRDRSSKEGLGSAKCAGRLAAWESEAAFE
jgi:hypothetical protein